MGHRAARPLLEGVGDEVEKSVHICCDYPEHRVQEGYLRPDRNAYFQLAPTIETSSIDAVSIEDARCNNDLSLLEIFKKTKVIFGAVAIASSRVETQEEFEGRFREALRGNGGGIVGRCCGSPGPRLGHDRPQG